MKNIIYNCYVKNSEHSLLLAFVAANIFCWLTAEGEIAYRIGNDGKIIVVSINKFKLLMGNKLGFKITIDGEDGDKNLNTMDLQLVSREKFNPFIFKEFYEQDGETFRNTFRTTKYMHADGEVEKEPKAIMALISNLFNAKEAAIYYFLNWLAYFWQGFKRPMTAILIKGRPGAGKNLFVDKVIAPMFGEKQTGVVGDQALRSNFLGGLFDGKLFCQFDEISFSMKDKSTLASTFKELITNPVVKLEKKYETLSDGVELFFLCLFSTNKSIPMQIEPHDRRLSVYSTGHDLNKQEFLGYGSYSNFIAALEEELMDFALYLKNFDVDEKLANTAQDTPEKDALVNATTNWYTSCYEALINKDLDYFEFIKEDVCQQHLYNSIVEDFNNNRLTQSKIKDYFNAVEDEQISTKQIMKQLRAMDAETFSKANSIGDSSGERYYLLPDHNKRVNSIPTHRDETVVNNYANNIPVPIIGGYIYQPNRDIS